MEHVLGWIGIAIAGCVTALLAMWRPAVARPLWCAFGLRAAAALMHFYVAPLPDGTADAVTFEKVAWAWGRDGFGMALHHYPGVDAYFYSWLGGLLYSVTGRSPLLLQSVSVVAGVLGVYATWRLAAEVWDYRSAGKAAWVMAVFPTVVMYGALTMREAFVVLFVLVGLHGVVRWARRDSMAAAVKAFASFGAATFFHGGIFVAALALLGLMVARGTRKFVAGLLKYRVRIVAVFGVVFAVVFASYYILSDMTIHKLGSPQDLISPEVWMFFFESRTTGGAKYPAWTQPSAAADLFWAVPLRVVYLLFSPFPWDVRKASQTVGLVDGVMYVWLAAMMWRSRREIWRDDGKRQLFLVLVPLLFAFGVGTGNFGTALRHRAKFTAVLIVLGARAIPRFVVGRANATPTGAPVRISVSKRHHGPFHRSQPA